MPRRASGARHQQNAARVLVEPVDQLGPLPLVIRQTVEQAVEMLDGLGPALRRQPWGLVKHEPVAALGQHHLLDEGGFVFGEGLDDPPEPGARSLRG